jgi:hypothetical protein
LWNTAVWSKTSQIVEKEGDVLSVSFSPSGQCFAAGGDFENEAGVIVCNCSEETDEFCRTFRLPLKGTSIAFPWNGMRLAIGSSTEHADGHIRILSEAWFQAFHKDSLESLIELANRCCPEAMYCLGIIYAQGKIREKELQRNDTEAAIWFRRAAAQGFVGGGRHQDALQKFYKLGEDKLPRVKHAHRPHLVWQQVADMGCLEGRDLSHLFADWSSAYDATVQRLANRSITFGDLLEIRRRHRISRDMTTRDVVNHIDIPMTSERRISYAEWLAEEKGRLSCAPNFHMIHAWDMVFEDLIMAASCAARGGFQHSMSLEKSLQSSFDANNYSEDELGVRVWVCAFCVNQHQDHTVGHPGIETDKFEKVLRVLWPGLQSSVRTGQFQYSFNENLVPGRAPRMQSSWHERAVLWKLLPCTT